MLPVTRTTGCTSRVATSVAVLNCPPCYALQHQRALHGDLWHAKRRLYDLPGAFAQWLSIPRHVICLDQRVCNGEGGLAIADDLPYAGYLFHVDLTGSIVLALTFNNRMGLVVAFDHDSDEINEFMQFLHDRVSAAEPENRDARRAWAVCGPGVSMDRLDHARDALGTIIGFAATTISLRELGDDEGGVILDVKNNRLIVFGCTRAARDELLTQYDARNTRLQRYWDSFLHGTYQEISCPPYPRPPASPIFFLPQPRS